MRYTKLLNTVKTYSESVILFVILGSYLLIVYLGKNFKEYGIKYTKLGK